jgi:sentrin-specific protease 7
VALKQHGCININCCDSLTFITLDSLGYSHRSAAAKLEEYLVAEGTKWSCPLTLDIPIRIVKAEGIPIQDNFDDCGVLTLSNIGTFLMNLDEVVNGLLEGNFIPDWASNAVEVRERIILDLKTKQGLHTIEPSSLRSP